MQLHKILTLFFVIFVLMGAAHLSAEPRTWDGKHSIEKIEVRVVYFVPKDREPLRDWKARVDYYCKRIEQFHRREYGGQSILKTVLEEVPLVSELTTDQLREGDANAIFFKTLRETDRRLKFAQNESPAFPILLVLSEINWRPLDDFYRLVPDDAGFKFEGNYNGQQHFPGAASGGARATYLVDQRKGWGLVSADGWRVPYRGSDCVIYHEGVGHTVGLPHPEPGNGSVMSMGQYRGWLNESWLDREQKLHMNWNPEQHAEPSPQLKLFSEFHAIVQPLVPQPGQEVSLKFNWPEGVGIKEVKIQIQTDLNGPWVQVPNQIQGVGANEAQLVSIGSFDRPTPVSYRIDATLEDGRTAELWGYFQVRSDKDELPIPVNLSVDLLPSPLEHLSN
ncbi:hypothetical protein [Thalassoglobus polymorphus]|nr:hypothetical protein [Thalassoglobus polymorphus]